MVIRDKKIDGGTAFDFGRVSAAYARFRDIYPDAFYERLVSRDLCVNGQDVLDLGTGTGVLPRNLYRYRANWTGIDISPEQIEQAKCLTQSNGMDIRFLVSRSEEIDFPEQSFDVVTACQCFWYFDHEKLAPVLHRLLRNHGQLAIMYMAWLPSEDAIAAESERITLKYNPVWSGAGEKMKPIEIPKAVSALFELTEHEEFKLTVPFTRESWHGRMRTCRGIGASLSGEKLTQWEREHRRFLTENVPERFDILHYAAFAFLKKRTVSVVR